MSTTVLTRTALEALRQHPAEWRRRGLTPPAELAEMVAVRTNPFPVADPTYADFFAA